MPSFAASPTQRPLFPPPFLWLAAFILCLGIYLGAIDNPLMHPGEELTKFNPQVVGNGGWRPLVLDSTPAIPGLGNAYRPVLASLLWFEWRVWGESPSSFHAVNLLLTGAIVFLFALLAVRLIEHPIGRWGAVLILAAHPLASESVLGISGQGTLLSLAASLAGCLALVWHRQGIFRPIPAAIAIFVAGFVAIGSNEMGLLLPIWLVAIAWLVPREAVSETRLSARRMRRRAAAEAGDDDEAPAGPRRLWPWAVFPMAGLVVGYLLLRNAAMGSIFPANDAIAAGWAGIKTSPAVAAPSVMLLGAIRLLWPIGPTLVYAPAREAGVLPAAALGWAFLVFALIAIGGTIRGNKILALAFILLLTPLAAISHWIPLSFFFSEEPMAFALPGLALLAGRLIEMAAATRGLGSPGGQRGFAALVALVALGMGWQTWKRSGEWANEKSLWRTEAARHPTVAEPQIELVAAEYRPGDPDAALAAAQRARALARPEDLDRIVEAEARVDAAEKRVDALQALIEAELDAKRPHRAGHLGELADIAMASGLTELAEELDREQIKQEPKAFKPNFSLAKSAYAHNNLAEAMKFAAQASASAPQEMRGLAYSQYAEILTALGKRDEAVLQFTEALRLDPTIYVAYIQLARLYWGRKDYAQAQAIIERCNSVIRVQSIVDMASIYFGLMVDQGKVQEGLKYLEGRVAALTGDVPFQLFAAEQFIKYGEDKRALEIYQGFHNLTGEQRVEQLAGLGKLFWTMEHNRDKALYWFKQALQLSPNNAVVLALIESVNAGGGPASPPKGSTGGSAPANAAGTTTATLAATPAPAAASTPQPGAGVSLGQ